MIFWNSTCLEEMNNIEFSRVSPVSKNDMKMNEMSISGIESKIGTSHFAADYGPIIISWQDSYFCAWTWEGLIVHQQHRGREMESVWPALNMLSHLGLHPDHNRAARLSFVSLAETVRNVRNCQARSAEQHLPTELFQKCFLQNIIESHYSARVIQHAKKQVCVLNLSYFLFGSMCVMEWALWVLWRGWHLSRWRIISAFFTLCYCRAELDSPVL